MTHLEETLVVDEDEEEEEEERRESEAQSCLDRIWYSLNCSARFDLVIISLPLRISKEIDRGLCWQPSSLTSFGLILRKGRIFLQIHRHLEVHRRVVGAGGGVRFRREASTSGKRRQRVYRSHLLCYGKIRVRNDAQRKRSYQMWDFYGHINYFFWVNCF